MWGTTLKTEIAWNDETERQPETKNRQHYWPRGRVLGGSSSINASIYVRGNLEDYNEWVTIHGCAGWGWNNVRKYIDKSEGCSIADREIIVDKAYHGYSGPLKISASTAGKPLPHTRVFIEACGRIGVGEGPEKNISGSRAAYAGLPFGRDYNGENQFGVGITHATGFRGVRQSTFRTFILPLVDRSSRSYRKNLTVLVNHQVVRLLAAEEGSVDGLKRISAVVMQKSRESAPLVVRANREVLLCAGA
ncbi:hypothetical protein HK405_010634, partial [Cladochytrium tenue]